MKITDISTVRNEVQAVELLSDCKAIEIVGGGDRGGPSDSCPPMIGHAGFLSSTGEIRRDKSNGKNTLASFGLAVGKYVFQSSKT